GPGCPLLRKPPYRHHLARRAGRWRSWGRTPSPAASRPVGRRASGTHRRGGYLIVDSIRVNFLDEGRLLLAAWQAFERDTARLLLANGFDDVRLVAGSGDHGADVLGVQRNELWVFQCKHTRTSPPPKDAIGEIVEAAKFYRADRLAVATSRPPGE